jgi:hypothetical protein
MMKEPGKERNAMEKQMSSKRTRWLAFTAFVVLAVFVVTWVRPRHVKVPSELVGTWTTDAPQYRDRSMEIDLASISFLTGGGTESTGFIDDISSVADNGKTFYTISYGQDETENQVSFYYEDGAKETLRFKNQESVVWSKHSTD